MTSLAVVLLTLITIAAGWWLIERCETVDGAIDMAVIAAAAWAVVLHWMGLLT